MSFKHLTVLLLVIMVYVNAAKCQVYNYTPIIHNDIETNPSLLASDKMNNRIQLYHQNSFSSLNTFSYSSLKLSKYFEPSFLGIGLSINNTSMGNSISYNHIGLGAGYRNVLFNKIYLKLGATYKIINTNSPYGSFDYFLFVPSAPTSYRKFNDGLNLALSFSSASDRYYVSMNLLNPDLPWHKTNIDIQFPTYYVLNVGNAMRFFDGDLNSELSYSGFGKYSAFKNKMTYSHYINIKLNTQLTRRSSFQYGSRLGFAENDYFHFLPFITYYNSKLALSLSYNFHLSKIKFTPKYISTTSLNLIYIL